MFSAGPPGFTNGTTARGKLIESRVKLNELEALKPKYDESPKSNTKVRFNLSVATIFALIILTVLNFTKFQNRFTHAEFRGRAGKILEKFSFI